MGNEYLHIHGEKQINSISDTSPLLLDEYVLWRKFKSGDMEAYAVIYRKYFFVLYQYGKKICPEQELIKDTIQDLFIKIWNNRENLNDTTSIKYYLLTSFRRKLVDALQSPHIKLAAENELLDISFTETQDSEEGESLEQKKEVLKALNCLSQHQQHLLRLKFYRNLSNKEIADEMGITIQSVYNAIFKILKSLRNQLSIIIVALGLL